MTKSSPRAVLDTNVIISSFFGGIPEAILVSLKQNSFHLFSSQPILDEVRDVLVRLFGQSVRVEEMIELLKEKAEFVVSKEKIAAIENDPTDNKFLECAVAGKVNYLVTGDKKHLLPLKKFRGILIVSPKVFLETI